jgi:hypothetical protein
MPSPGHRAEDDLIDLFLTVYEDSRWKPPLSTLAQPDKTQDSAVEVIATRVADQMTLAIEHTLIEPFVGEKSDYHSRFKVLGEDLRTNPALKVAGEALWVNVPVNAVPRGASADLIAEEVAKWLEATRGRFSSEPTTHDCPSPSHPNQTIRLQVRRDEWGGGGNGFVIVGRYGDMMVNDSVRKALAKKLPKLVGTKVNRRILMLERDQMTLAPADVHHEVEALRPEFPALASVDEVWIADTVPGGFKEYAEFYLFENGKRRESFAFFQGRLHSRAKNGMPLPVKRST